MWHNSAVGNGPYTLLIRGCMQKPIVATVAFSKHPKVAVVTKTIDQGNVKSQTMSCRTMLGKVMWNERGMSKSPEVNCKQTNKTLSSVQSLVNINPWKESFDNNSYHISRSYLKLCSSGHRPYARTASVQNRQRLVPRKRWYGWVERSGADSWHDCWCTLKTIQSTRCGAMTWNIDGGFTVSLI